jgi:hypothetical protein
MPCRALGWENKELFDAQSSLYAVSTDIGFDRYKRRLPEMMKNSSLLAETRLAGRLALPITCQRNITR